MRKTITAGIAALTLTAAATLGAGTAHAQDQDLEMPSFEGMTLAEAQASWSSLTGGASELGTKIMNSSSLQPMNPATWEVCGQKPRPGSTISASTSADVAVSPPGNCYQP
ncbi:MAG: hypothetical protein SW019_13555 [Actinomycetota bacterium]|nr:hypothetical protein [Actinomycetota bacterium]